MNPSLTLPLRRGGKRDKEFQPLDKRGIQGEDEKPFPTFPYEGKE
jgi:hypothetical protein